MDNEMVVGGSLYKSVPKKRTYFIKGDSKSVSRTKQSFRDECDINKIMDKVTRGIQNIDRPSKQPIYGDFSNVSDYPTMLNNVRKVQNAFNQVPAKVRAMFNNDPSQLIQFLSDPANNEKAMELGLAPKPVKAQYFKTMPDGTQVDITDEIEATRGLYQNGVRVNKAGLPVTPAEEAK